MQLSLDICPKLAYSLPFYPVLKSSLLSLLWNDSEFFGLSLLCHDI